MLKKFGFSVPVPAASFTGGLVGDASPFAIFPKVRYLIHNFLSICCLYLQK